MASFDSTVLSKFKDTFRRIAFPATDGAEALNHLVTMNLPAQMARRDAAYEQAVILLRKHLFSLSEEGRSQIYSSVLELLEIAMEATKQIPYPSSTGTEVKSGPILQYLLLLSDTIQAANALVNHELLLFKGEKEISDFIGGNVSNQLISTDEIFNNSEMNIFHCISDLVDMAESAIVKHCEHKKKQFTKSDLERYKKAYAEFSSLYGKFGLPNKS